MVVVVGSIQKSVSNQLGSPASGDLSILIEYFCLLLKVSNQLGSPASGDSSYTALSMLRIR